MSVTTHNGTWPHKLQAVWPTTAGKNGTSSMEDQLAENECLREQLRLYQDALAFTGHEWRNHISRLILFAEKMQHEVDGPLNSQQKETVKRIRQSATALRCIARNYLRMVQVGDSVFTLQPSLIDPVRDVIEPVLSSYADWLAEREQTCQIKVSSPDTLIWADRWLLMSVFDNLINNAIKYGEPGGTILLHQYQRGTTYEFGVWNSGQGIPPGDLEGIFERFAHNMDTQATESTGIGLYLARKIVEAHGGRLWADSQPGAWAAFSFTLPSQEAVLRNRGE